MAIYGFKPVASGPFSEIHSHMVRVAFLHAH